VIASGTQAIEPTVTNEEESSALGVPLHSPAFLFERTSRDPSGRTVEFVHSVYRGDRYRIVTELNRP
jgi:GntR family transcriptional regulator